MDVLDASSTLTVYRDVVGGGSKNGDILWETLGIHKNELTSLGIP